MDCAEIEGEPEHSETRFAMLIASVGVDYFSVNELMSFEQLNRKCSDASKVAYSRLRKIDLFAVLVAMIADSKYPMARLIAKSVMKALIWIKMKAGNTHNIGRLCLIRFLPDMNDELRKEIILHDLTKIQFMISEMDLTFRAFCPVLRCFQDFRTLYPNRIYHLDLRETQVHLETLWSSLNQFAGLRSLLLSDPVLSVAVMALPRPDRLRTLHVSIDWFTSILLCNFIASQACHLENLAIEGCLYLPRRFSWVEIFSKLQQLKSVAIDDAPKALFNAVVNCKAMNSMRIAIARDAHHASNWIFNETPNYTAVERNSYVRSLTILLTFPFWPSTAPLPFPEKADPINLSYISQIFPNIEQLSIVDHFNGSCSSSSLIENDCLRKFTHLKSLRLSAIWPKTFWSTNVFVPGRHPSHLQIYFSRTQAIDLPDKLEHLEIDFSNHVTSKYAKTVLREMYPVYGFETANFLRYISQFPSVTLKHIVLKGMLLFVNKEHRVYISIYGNRHPIDESVPPSPRETLFKLIRNTQLKSLESLSVSFFDEITPVNKDKVTSEFVQMCSALNLKRMFIDVPNYRHICSVANFIETDVKPILYL